MAEVDAERLLAAAARRMAKLGFDRAAVALSDSSVHDVRHVFERQFRVDLLAGSDSYDALKAHDVSARRERIDPEDGSEILIPSVLEEVFVSVLPPGTEQVEVKVSIRNDPVTNDWREVDSEGRLRPPSPRVIAHLDPSKVPAQSDVLLHLARLNRLDQEPEEMIGAAKDLIEATAKLVLLELKEPFDAADDVSAVSKKALTRLNLHPETIAPTTKGAETIRRILGGLQQIAAGLAELRNMGYGTGHGRGQRVAGLAARHAELAARASAAYVSFVLATLYEPSAPWRKKAPPSQPNPEPAKVPLDPPRTRTYRDGDRVQHPRWGEGIVISSRVSAFDEELTVAFRDPSVGRKTLIASLASLERMPKQT